jgi:hypothetical protein
MSTDLAITAVTRTIRQIIAGLIETNWGNVLEGPLTKAIEVTNLLPHKVRDTHASANVINVFLYKTDYNAAWRNLPPPPTPLAINLEYLITAYGEDDKEEAAHFFLAQAMRILHDNAVLPRDLFKSVLPKAKVHLQIEQVTITSKPITIEELSKLWAMFQTQFRICASYLVTVLLIESQAASRNVLPVLKRGPDDSGVTALAGALPVLDLAKPATGFAAARLGEDVELHGQRLDMSGIVARVRHPLMTAAVDLPVTNVDAGRMTFTLPEALGGSGVAAAWPAGIYTVALSGTLPNNVAWATNSVSFPLAPSITVSPTQVVAPGGDFEVTIEAIPQIREDQQIVVIYGSAPKAVKTPIAVPATDDDPTVVKFDAPDVVGLHRVRLRVDGVDSIPIVKVADKLEFDPDQSVEVQP